MKAQPQIIALALLVVFTASASGNERKTWLDDATGRRYYVNEQGESVWCDTGTSTVSPTKPTLAQKDKTHCSNGECKKISVTTHCVSATPDCTKIDNPVSGSLPTDSEDIPLYAKCVEKKAPVDVPYIIKRTTHTRKFKMIEVKEQCCIVKVCVPYEDCCLTKCHCEVRNIPETNIKAYLRHDGNVDVYAIDVQGMPKQWVAAYGITRAEAKQKYGVEF